jgi:hypothetical protein
VWPKPSRSSQAFRFFLYPSSFGHRYVTIRWLQSVKCFYSIQTCVSRRLARRVPEPPMCHAIRAQGNHGWPRTAGSTPGRTPGRQPPDSEPARPSPTVENVLDAVPAPLRAVDRSAMDGSSPSRTVPSCGRWTGPTPVHPASVTTTSGLAVSRIPRMEYRSETPAAEELASLPTSATKACRRIIGCQQTRAQARGGRQGPIRPTAVRIGGGPSGPEWRYRRGGKKVLASGELPRSG